MQMSEPCNAFSAAFAAAQAAMGVAKKDNVNPFFKSKYADMGAVVEAIKEALNQNGIAYMQFPCTNEKDEVGIETLLLHSSGEWIRSEPFFVPVAKADAQGFGSAITYAKRYGLQAICGVPSEDDDGNDAAKARPVREALADPVDLTEQRLLMSTCTSLEEFARVWSAFPVGVKRLLEADKNQRKTELSGKVVKQPSAEDVQRDFARQEKIEAPF